jgi:hypothetical protein
MKNYSFTNVSVTVAGKILSGFAEDIAVEIVTEIENNELMTGAGGDVTRVYKSDTRARITIHLMNNSDDNAYLENLLSADEIAQVGVIPVRVTDLNTGRKYTAPNCVFATLAPVTFGKNLSTRSWILLTDKVNTGDK